jgi:hypothetical protein
MSAACGPIEPFDRPARAPRFSLRTSAFAWVKNDELGNGVASEQGQELARQAYIYHQSPYAQGGRGTLQLK